MANVATVKENAEKKPSDITTLIQQSVKELGKALPSHMNPERLVRIALTTLRLNPKLYICTPASFLGALFQSAQLGLEPNIEGQAYIIPYNNSKKINNEWVKVMEAQFQIGFKGYVELFYRHQNSTSLDMQEVRDKDYFDYAYGTDSFLKHKPAMMDRGEVIAYYAVARLKDIGSVFKVMSKDECMDHGKQFSKCYDVKKGEFYEDTPWKTNPDAMCRKTVLIQLMKLLPKSIEIQRALAMDETIKTTINADMAAIPDTTDWANGKKTEDAQVVDAKPEENEYKKLLEQCQTEKARVGDKKYYKILGGLGYEHANQMRNFPDLQKFINELKAIETQK